MTALPTGALRFTLLAHGVEVARNAVNALGNFSAVGFKLGFAFATAHTDAARLPRQVSPEPRQPREQMLELCEFNLEFAFARACAL